MVRMGSKPGRIVAALLILLLLAGFFYFNPRRSLDDAESIIDSTLKQGKRITSYQFLLELAFNQGNETREHFAQVWYRSPHFFRVELFPSCPEENSKPDQVIVSDGEKIWLSSPEMGDFFPLDPGVQELAPTPFLLNNFLNGLANSREREFLGIEKKEKHSYYLLRVVPQDSRRDHAYEEIWLEKGTMLPVQILVYDQQDKLKQRVLFRKTILNADIPEEFFQIDNKGGTVKQ